MKLDFAKLHGAGNDFVLIDDLSEELTLSDEQTRFLCDRHFGIGADGVILVRPSKRDDCVAYMHYINDDGSLAEMCGNGIRCFAKYLVDRGFIAASQRNFVVETLAGRRAISFETDGAGALVRATVDMGEPAFEPQLIPTTLEANGMVGRCAADGELVEEPAVIEAVIELLDVPTGVPAIELPGFESSFPPLDSLRFTCVNMGNPHAVAFLEGDDEVLRALDWHGWGRALEHHPVFPARANIELARVIQPGRPVGLALPKSLERSASFAPSTPPANPAPPDADGEREQVDAQIEMRVWERGVGETLACGTGACATAVAAALTGRAARRATVCLPGGDLHVEWLENNHVMMTGPAATVYEGTIEL
jgi:diaminopimelate epimerase